jgi:hypothetical protein
VVEPRDYDFVSRLQFAANRTRDGVSQRRHVRTEGDFVRATVQKISHGGASFGNHGVGSAAGGVSSASVGIVAVQVVRDGINHALRNLRPAGAVEECGGVAIQSLGERGELGADGGYV